MDNKINQMLDTLIGVKAADIKKIEERMANDKETLALYRAELAAYETQKAEANR